MRLTEREQEALRKMLAKFVAGVDDPADRGVLVHLQDRIEGRRQMAEVDRAPLRLGRPKKG